MALMLQSELSSSEKVYHLFLEHSRVVSVLDILNGCFVNIVHHKSEWLRLGCKRDLPQELIAELVLNARLL